MSLAANICLEKTTYSFDSLFSYSVPDAMAQTLQKGCRVLVPFGRSNTKRQGLVMELQDLPTDKLKPIFAQVDPTPLWNEELLWLMGMLRENTFCTYYDVLKVLIPTGMGVRVEVNCSLNRNWEGDKATLTPVQQQMVDYLATKQDWVDIAKLAGAMGVEGNSPDLTDLIADGAVFAREYAKTRVGERSETMARLTTACEEDSSAFGTLPPKQQRVLELLGNVGCAGVKEICYFCGTGRGVVLNLAKKGAIELFDRIIYRNPFKDKENGEKHPQMTLSPLQQQAYDQIVPTLVQGFGVTLLYGVTGSGKTQVFLHLIQQVLEQGKQAILLVPEIALTPQTISLFKELLGEQVGVLHSGLSLGERADEYKRIREGTVGLVVGTRSAVFAPLPNLGLIVIDEEQEHTYKSEKTPRFHAREVAKARCRYHSAPLLLASATPSIESYYHAKEGHYKLVEMHERFTGSTLPDVYIVDMKDAPGALFSPQLLEGIAENLEKEAQTILLLNRRGYHTLVKCSGCGEVATCPNCSIPLTFHQTNTMLICHYCGHSEASSQPCRLCGNAIQRYSGVGTQKVEEQLEEVFPDARILRMDMDTTLSKFAHERRFGDFLDGKYDIMVGTQMVAKGHNFPKVTLVGVLSVDSSLYSEDFRSYERAFSLVTQVVGRSGRGKQRGRAILQTYTPENPVLLQASAQDYPTFYAAEIASRQVCLYPPYCNICMAGFVGEDRGKVMAAAHSFAQAFMALARGKYANLPIRLLGPCEPTVFKAAGKFRYKLLIKCRMDKSFCTLLWELLRAFERDKNNKGVSIFIDPTYDHSM